MMSSLSVGWNASWYLSIFQYLTLHSINDPSCIIWCIMFLSYFAELLDKKVPVYRRSSFLSPEDNMCELSEFFKCCPTSLLLLFFFLNLLSVNRTAQTVMWYGTSAENTIPLTAGTSPCWNVPQQAVGPRMIDINLWGVAAAELMTRCLSKK